MPALAGSGPGRCDGANWSTVLRGSFGTFYELGSGSLGGVSSYFPYHAVKSLPLAAFPLTATNAMPPVLTTNPPVNTIYVSDPHLKLPHTYEWNSAVEQSLGSGQTLSLTYIGAIGRDLLRVTDLVCPYRKSDRTEEA